MKGCLTKNSRTSRQNCASRHSRIRCRHPPNDATWVRRGKSLTASLAKLRQIPVSDIRASTASIASSEPPVPVCSNTHRPIGQLECQVQSSKFAVCDRPRLRTRHPEPQRVLAENLSTLFHHRSDYSYQAFSNQNIS